MNVGQRLKCRIHQFFPDSLLMKLDQVCKNKLISDNNKKVKIILNEVLPQYNLNYRVLGPGTNRLAILVDGYAFKIAVDHLGVKDNWAEFALCKELYPFVTKVYECNGLIAVHEYVKVMSKTEFTDRRSEIANILSNFAPDWLIGDVGTIAKNYLNWGLREDDEPVILDFAYFYHINWSDVHCDFVHQNGTVCDGEYRYNNNYSYLVCNRCGHKALFTDILGRLTSNYELENIQLSKKGATKVSRNVTEVEADKTITVSSLGYADLFTNPGISGSWYPNEGENEMTGKELWKEEKMDIDQTYMDELAFIASMSNDAPQPKSVEELNADDDYELETTAGEYVDDSDPQHILEDDDIHVGDELHLTSLPESQPVVDDVTEEYNNPPAVIQPTEPGIVTPEPTQDDKPSSFVKVIKPERPPLSPDQRADYAKLVAELVGPEIENMGGTTNF